MDVVRLNPRIAEVGRKYGGVVLATAISQAISAISLFALSLLGLAVSDIYAVGLQAGSSAFAGIVSGVLYTLLVGRPRFSKWRTAALLCSMASLIITFIAAVTYPQLSDGNHLALGVFGACAIGGAGLAYAGVFAVRKALAGNAYWLVAISVPGSLGILLGIALTRLVSLPPIGLVAPSLLWAVANLCMAVILPRTRFDALRVAADVQRPEAPRTFALHALGLGIGAITSTLIPPLYLSIMSSLAAGTTTFLFLITRIGNAVVGFGINAVLIKRYQWGEERSSWIPAVTIAMAIGLVLVFCAQLIARVSPEGPAADVVLGLAWMLTIGAPPIALREVNALRLHRTIIGKSVTDVLVSLGAFVMLSRSPSVSNYLAALMCSQFLTAAWCGIGLRTRGLVIVSVVGLALCILMLAGGI